MYVNVVSKEDFVQEQILQAAQQLFATYGLAKVTMDDVAKAIGKTRGSIYYYYKSKDEIFDAVINIQLKETRSIMEIAVAGETNAEDKISAFFISKLKLVRERSSFFDALESGMDADAISNFNKTKLIYHESTMKWEGALLNRILNEGIMNSELKPIEKKEMDNLVFMLLSTLHGLKRQVRTGNNIVPIEPAVAQFTRTIMQGLNK